MTTGLRHATSRIEELARHAAALALMTVRYPTVRACTRHVEATGESGETGPALRPDLVDDRVLLPEHGAGPLLHRRFRVRVRRPGRDAADLIATLATDLDRAAPYDVASFRKTRGRVGELVVGDEYRVSMPAPWDGPVRVVDRTPTSFRLATLVGHVEAGQIEFRAVDHEREVVFEIETWARLGDRAAAVVFDRLRVGKEVQLHMWVQFCLAVAADAGGTRVGPVEASTRRCPWQG